jgi:hypothetical protein
MPSKKVGNNLLIVINHEGHEDHEVIMIQFAGF